MTIIEVVPVGIVRVWVGGRGGHHNCIQYDTIYSDGLIATGGLISIDKTWFKASPHSHFPHKLWLKLEWNQEENTYVFSNKMKYAKRFGWEKADWKLHEKVIQIVDEYAVENLLLK